MMKFILICIIFVPFLLGFKDINTATEEELKLLDEVAEKVQESWYPYIGYDFIRYIKGINKYSINNKGIINIKITKSHLICSVGLILEKEIIVSHMGWDKQQEELVLLAEKLINKPFVTKCELQSSNKEEVPLGSEISFTIDGENINLGNRDHYNAHSPKNIKDGVFKNDFFLLSVPYLDWFDKDMEIKKTIRIAQSQFDELLKNISDNLKKQKLLKGSTVKNKNKLSKLNERIKEQYYRVSLALNNINILLDIAEAIYSLDSEKEFQNEIKDIEVGIKNNDITSKETTKNLELFYQKII